MHGLHKTIVDSILNFNGGFCVSQLFSQKHIILEQFKVILIAKLLLNYLFKHTVSPDHLGLIRDVKSNKKIISLYNNLLIKVS